MNINCLNGVQNYGAIKNSELNKTNTNFVADKDIDVPKSQMVNAQTALANFSVKNTSFKGGFKNEEITDEEFEKLKKEFEKRIKTQDLPEHLQTILEYGHFKLNKYNVNLTFKMLNNLSLCDPNYYLAYTINNVNSKEKSDIFNKLFSTQNAYKNEDIILNAGSIIASANNEEQVKLINKIFSNEENLKNGDILQNAGDIIRWANTDDTIKLANKIFDNKELYGNKEVLQNASKIIRWAQNEDKIKLANKIFTNKEFYENKEILRNASDIIYRSSSKEQIELVNKVFDNKELYTNKNVVNWMGRIIGYAKTPEQLELADKIFSNKELYENKNVLKWASCIISETKTPEQVKLANEILDNKELYGNKNVVINAKDIIKSVKTNEDLKIAEEKIKNTDNNETKKTDKTSDDFLSYLPEEFYKFFSFYYNSNGPICPNSLQNLSSKLRDSGDEKINHIEEEVLKNVDNAFKELPELKEEKVLYRAINNDDKLSYFYKTMSNAQIGDEIIPDRGYTQVGLYSDFAAGYLADENADCDKYFFEMIFPKGSKISFSKRTGSGAKEGFLPRNAKFRVVNKEENYELKYTTYHWGTREDCTNKVTKFTLEYILPDDDNINEETEEIEETEEVNEINSIQENQNVNIDRVSLIEEQKNVSNISNLDKEIMEKISRLTENQKMKLNDFLASILR